LLGEENVHRCIYILINLYIDYQFLLFFVSFFKLKKIDKNLVSTQKRI